MKIYHTIIRNGIARGILEGTKVPEKPKEIEGKMQSGTAIKEARKRVYEKAIQALWDSSVEWEDQEAAGMLIRYAQKPLYSNFKPEEDGIYPLEGVNAEKVEQAWFVFRNEWVDKCYAEMSKGYYSTDFRWRTVLRLIPQPNSERTFEQALADQDALERQERKEAVEGTEVSEPLDTGPMEVAYAQAMAKPGCDVGGVSGGEPNQEELFTELITEIQRMEVVDAIDYAKSKFHIQKLKS